MNNNTMGIMVIAVIIAIVLFGGTKNTGKGPTTPEQKQGSIQQELNKTQNKVEELKKQVQAEEDKKTKSEYNGIVDLQAVRRSTDVNEEYLIIRTTSEAKSVSISGWKIRSTASGATVTIPKAAYLFFAGTANSEQDIFLGKNELVYLTTGISPNGASFKLNKCSGYLAQFQNFSPYINGLCPIPNTEDLSSIPKTVNNDSCFNHIDSMSSCRIQTDPLPPGSSKWSTECTDFIYKKINYPACVNAHKNDKDFYLREWRVYLKRSEPIWKYQREHIVLYDLNGKIVDELTY